MRHSKKFIYKYLLLIIPVLFIFSCKKAVVKPLILDPVADYLPTTPGSTWTYGVTEGDTAYRSGPTFTITMTSDILNKFGQTFTIASSSSPSFDSSNQFYFSKTGGPYKVYITIVHDFQNFDIPILLSGRTSDRDTSFYVPDPDPSLPPAYQVTSNAVKPLQTETVQGKTYKDCSEVFVSINKRYDGDDPTLKNYYYFYTSYVFYFAPNVGIIKEYTNSQSIFLISYDIKQ
jgi:hypothetical protein